MPWIRLHQGSATPTDYAVARRRDTNHAIAPKEQRRMDVTPFSKKASLQTQEKSKQAALLRSLVSEHAKNNTASFKQLLSANTLQPDELKAIWPAIMRMTIYNMPIDPSTPTTNSEFSQIVNEYNTKHESLVHCAARKGALDALSNLLTQDTLHSQNLNGETPLFVAVLIGNLQIAQMLLANKADPLIGVSLGMTPLHISNSVAMTQLLHDSGARVLLDKQDAFGQPPLFHAIQRNDPEVATLLINLGAQVNLANLCGETLLHGTSNCGMLKLDQAVILSKKLLEAKANVNAQCNDNRTPLHMAAEDRLIPLIHLFLTHGADTTLKDRWGRTAASMIHDTWGVTPEKLITICNTSNGKTILSEKARAIAQKSFEHIPTKTKVKARNTSGKGTRNKNNCPTFAQVQAKKQSATKSATTPATKTNTLRQSIGQPTDPVLKQAITLIFADRVTKWQDAEWLKKEEQKAQKLDVYEYWQFLRKRLYHSLPEKILHYLFEYGTPEPRANQTHDGQMDTQYVLEGEMQFGHQDNPWKPGKQRQPGFYHITRGIDGIIYHVGFKPIQNRGFRLSDFMQEEIPFKFVDAETDNYIAVHDPKEGVRHVLYLKVMQLNLIKYTKNLLNP